MIEKHFIPLDNLGRKLEAVESVCGKPCGFGWVVVITNDPDVIAQRNPRPYPTIPTEQPRDYYVCEEKAA